MLAARYDKTISIPTVKSMYDLVRQVMGLTMLNAPYFTFESLIAFYLVSLWAPTVLTEIPVDSWTMSLQALNQCVLADQIKFSRYHANDLGSQGQIGWYRLWNALVLNHVQWTIATSRPFSVPEYYISQCKKIYQFAQISDKDKMITAEIYLYRNLIKLTWDTLVILPSDGLKIDSIEDWKNEFYEVYSSSNAFFRFKYDFAYAVIFRTYLRQESGSLRDKGHDHSEDGESKGAGSRTFGDSIGDKGGELAVNGRSHRLAKECVVIALIHHALTILETFNNEPSYDPRIIDVSDYDFFIIIYCAMTLCEISILLWKKVRDKLWYGDFVCTSVEEYYERSVDKLRYCYQDDTISITPNKVHDYMVQSLANFKRYSFNEGHVCSQFASILEELIRKTDEALLSSTNNTPADTTEHAIDPPRFSTVETPKSVPQAIPEVIAPKVPNPMPGTYKEPYSFTPKPQFPLEEANKDGTPAGSFSWYNEANAVDLNVFDASKFSPMDSYESFYIADDADVFRRIFPGGLLTLDNMN